jgi:general L-amino acid transport system permease protein
MAVDVERRAAAVKGSFWRDARVRGVLLQVLVAGLFIAFVAFVAHNTATNLRNRGISTGFGFLGNTSGFDIGFKLIAYELTESYGRAYVVSLVNTLFVSAIGIVLATLLGFVVGVMRLSRNWLVARLAAVYVEGLRNVPLALQIIFWYFGVLSALPPPRQSLSVGEAIFINIKAVSVPRAIFEPGFAAIPVALAVGVIATIVLARWAKRRQEATGRQFPTIRAGLALNIGLPLLAAIVTGFPLSWEYPVLKGFNFAGGVALQPEFIALLIALSTYTAAFIAEIVRAGIQAVSHGQTEAAYALGLRPGQTTRLVIIPQALRVIVPPLTSQYLNLTKNSSLAVLIGYPDLVSVFFGTVANQTGKVVEVVFITMLTYGTISLLIAIFMNWYNRRIALVER